MTRMQSVILTRDMVVTRIRHTLNESLCLRQLRKQLWKHWKNINHLFFSTMVVHRHSMTDHGIAEGSNGKRHQTIPGGEEHHGGGVDPADEGWI